VLLDFFETEPFPYEYARFGRGSLLREFNGEGAYTVNGELARGTYRLNPGGGTCAWSRLGTGGDPDFPHGDAVLDSGETRKEALITLGDNDRILVLSGCGRVRLIGSPKP
jgi:hypothetical protein